MTAGDRQNPAEVRGTEAGSATEPFPYLAGALPDRVRVREEIVVQHDDVAGLFHQLEDGPEVGMVAERGGKVADGGRREARSPVLLRQA